MVKTHGLSLIVEAPTVALGTGSREAPPNVLIALATPEQSERARGGVVPQRASVCDIPITQCALLRFHLRAGVEAMAESAKLLIRLIKTATFDCSGSGRAKTSLGVPFFLRVFGIGRRPP